MTDEEIDQVVEATSPRPAKRWTAPFKRFWTWFVETTPGRFLARKTTVANLIIAVLVMASGYPLVISSLGAVNARIRHADLGKVSQDIYVAKVVDYSQAVATYQICLDGVTRSDANRQQWSELADIIAALDVGSGKAIAFADEIRTGPLLSSPARTVDSCLNPGAPPVAPAP